MENKIKNYLLVEWGSRGEIDNIEWVKNKSFEEIEKRCKGEYDENVEMFLNESGEGNEWVEDYVDEFCYYVKDKENGCGFGKNEEEWVCYYVEDLVEELKGVDLMGEDDYDKVNEVLFDVSFKVGF